ncbi:UNVERIFIED_CONTAM: hypothetical protein FKN15_009461 [Acipenser sinensis]
MHNVTSTWWTSRSNLEAFQPHLLPTTTRTPPALRRAPLTPPFLFLLRCPKEFCNTSFLFLHGRSINAGSLASHPDSLKDKAVISIVTSGFSELRASSGSRKARVLYDYDAADSSELSLLADEVITVSSVPGMDTDWLMGERGSQKGRVPITYLELLN